MFGKVTDFWMKHETFVFTVKALLKPLKAKSCFVSLFINSDLPSRGGGGLNRQGRGLNKRGGVLRVFLRDDINKSLT